MRNKLLKKNSSIDFLGKVAEKLNWFPPQKAISDYTASQNLGQTYNDVPRYKCVDQDGNNAGVGYGFEDMTKRMLEEAGNTVENVSPTYCGADMIVNGKPCQLKCGENGHKSAAHLYHEHYGPYKYGEQDAIVPKGQGRQAEKTVRMRKQMSCGGPDRIIESPVSREMAEKYTKRGWGSFLMDVSDPKIYMPSVKWGIGIAAIGAAADIYINREEISMEMVAKKTLKWIGFGTVFAVCNIGLGCANRQTLRP